VSLTAGARLGPYEILGALGAGGMGEVYRARDTKLNRDVAVKVLPDVFVADPERAARFAREAQLLAALNHPHIAQVFGLEELKGPDGRVVSSIVLEFVDGESLAQKLDAAGGSGLGVHESLRIAHQIVDAVEAAHEKGIVHRDLKPANIMLTADGQVKVLDFGLAKYDGGPGAPAGPGGLSHSPTLTFAGTLAGMILGTATYMSPEQAKGRDADKRCDVWAFGCVMFEMLAGRRAFDGEDATEVIAAIVRADPDWNALPADTPPHLRAIVKRCLEKDRKVRIPDLSVVRFLMNEAPSLTNSASPESRLPHRLAAWRRALPWAVAGTATLAAGGLFLNRQPSSARPLVRLHATPAASVTLNIDPFAIDVAISPDGRRLAYTTGTTQPQLYVREFDREEATQVADVMNVRGPFFSPDGEWVGFFQGADVKKASVRGGSPITICAECAPGNRGAAWGDDDTITFAVQGGGLLRRVPASGGALSDVARPDHAKGEQGIVFPEFIPGRDAIVYTVLFSGGRLDDSVIVARDLRTGTQHVLARGGVRGQVVAGTHLVYGATGTLLAVRFDPGRLATSGSPVPIVHQVVTKPTGAADFGVSRDGTLVYVQGGAQASGMTLAWRDRQGRDEPIAAPPRAYTHPRVSPDGTRIALDVRDQDLDIWIWDTPKQTLSRFTFDQGLDENAVWTPDGKRIAYSSFRAGTASVYWQAADGTGVAERLSPETNSQVPWAFNSDGQSLVIRDTDLKTGVDLAILTVDGKRVTPLIQQPSYQGNADLSPDGKWIAYQSNQSGRNEIYVHPFPSVGAGRWQISTDGGTRPVWARNGRELFYLDETSRLVAVPVQAGATFNSGSPATLFELPSTPTATARTYDVAPDGRFLVINFPKNDKTSNAPTLNVVLNWTDELERLMPAKK